ncbi:uncharacterized protein LOC126856944 [Cataglyphis hispanica]|uniref:uncharacterized protein LOC126856944 n=1 Tax=Cataglyphis hispanica TaxID=1086592 RepID=UPI00217FBA73|nr:uncharacterized protein LOC126856944 [Cataglyphis hispanica]
MRILQLRKEIIAFKNENELYLTMTCNFSSLTPSELNDSTKNVGKRTDAQNELQRNFKGDDLPNGTDLSARLSFTKRALEIKATNEAVVFKEDYPRDNKSIEDDEWPNRSRVSETLEMYRRSISDSEKFGKEISERSGKVKDIGDVKISCVADEKLKSPDKHQNNNKEVVINNMYDCPSNVTTLKIKRKRISRGVQYSSLIECQNHAKRFLLGYFGSKSTAKKYNLTRKMERKETLTDKEEKFYIGSRNKMNESLDATTICNESHNVKLNNTDMKEELENDTKKIGKIIYPSEMNRKKLFIRLQNTNDTEKRKKDNSKNRKVKINPFEKLWPSKALTCNNNLKVQQNRSLCNFNVADDSENNKKETVKSNFETNRNDARKHEHDSQNKQSVNILDHKIDSNARNASAIANSDRESMANKVKERLDTCIVELNGIIDDACVVFGSGKSVARTADRV